MSALAPCSKCKTRPRVCATKSHCQPCINAHQRIRRAATKNATTRRYEKTPNGYLMRTYRNMESRVTGVLKTKAHLYKGLPILSRAHFYLWARNSPQFTQLFTTWEAAGYPPRLAPSINRINNAKGYVPGNIEWITHSENSARTRRFVAAAQERNVS